MTLTLEIEQLQKVATGLQKCAEELSTLQEVLDFEKQADFWQGENKRLCMEKVRPMLSVFAEQQIRFQNSATKLSMALSRYAETETTLVQETKQLSTEGMFE